MNSDIVLFLTVYVVVCALVCVGVAVNDARMRRKDAEQMRELEKNLMKIMKEHTHVR